MKKAKDRSMVLHSELNNFIHRIYDSIKTLKTKN